jgi:predicted ATPase
MDGQRFITSLHLKNLLSFGPNAEKIDLQPLNVLIGPNASGKSNFIEAINILRWSSISLASPFIHGGGVSEFLFKGSETIKTAEIISEIAGDAEEEFLRHSLSFTSRAQGLQVIDESVEPLVVSDSATWPLFYYRYNHGYPVTNIPDAFPYHISEDEVAWELNGEWTQRSIKEALLADASILSQRTDPDLYPALNFLAKQYFAIKIYKSFTMDGPQSLRYPQRTDLPSDFLAESGLNLSLVINNLAFRGALRTVVKKMQTVYDDVEDITAKIEGGTVQTYIRERGMREPIPAGRLSDGTLRFLCLLVILYHPTPPPLICIEEPELGMHPDVIPTIAEMLIEASSRTQLIVTTHSDLLISKLGDIPEAVVVCERTDQGSVLRRLEKDKLSVWLENYSLGDLWLRGEIGGTRW